MTEWIVDRLETGDVVQAGGPQGNFTLRSERGTPLVFVSGGTDFAPVKAMIEQELALDSSRDIVLFRGVSSDEDLYELDEVGAWAASDVNLRCTLAIEHGTVPVTLSTGITAVAGNLANVLAISGKSLAGRDAYVAGPPEMIPTVLSSLRQRGVERTPLRSRQ